MKDKKEYRSHHAFSDEALLLLSIDPNKSGNKNYLKAAADLNLIVRYPRGLRSFVYDRDSLSRFSQMLDKGVVKVDTQNYSFQYDFQTGQKAV